MTAPEIETKSFAFELKGQADAEGGGASFEGVVACFLNIDAAQDLYVPGCFAGDLAFFLAEGVLRDEHCVTTGRIDHAQETTKGLAIKATILPTTAGRDQATLVRGRAIKRLSIGACNWGHWTTNPEEVKSLWAAHGHEPSEQDVQRLAHGVRIITRARPYEASTTWLPVNDATTITQVKGGGGGRRLPFAAQADEAIRAAEAFAERAEALAKLREADGRRLGKKAIARVRDLVERLERAATASPPSPTAEELADQLLFNQYLAREARINGVQI